MLSNIERIAVAILKKVHSSPMQKEGLSCFCWDYQAYVSVNAQTSKQYLYEQTFNTHKPGVHA